MNALNRARLAAVGFTLVLSMPAIGQVFVRTVLDRKPPAEQLTEQQSAICNTGDPLKDKDCKQRLTVAANLPATELVAAAKSAICNTGDLDCILNTLKKLAKQAALNDMKSKLDALYNTQPLPADDDFKKQVSDICNKDGWALTNRPSPVAWNSARSVCFWNQPGLEFAKAAQIVGGDSQGTASVEVVSDVFWGLRVRIQTSVAGTDSSDPDGQAKALLKQLQTAGGNISIGATYPWYALEKSPEPGASSNSDPRVQAVLTSFFRVGGAVPALGNDSNSTTIKATDANGSLELALIDAALQLRSYKRSINFVLTGRASVVNGSHKFNETIKNTGHRGFAYGQIGAGIRFLDSVWVLASRTYYSHSLPGSGMTYSVMFGK